MRHNNIKNTNATTTALHPFNGLSSRTTWVSRYQKGRNQSGYKSGKRLWDFGMAVAPAGPYANNLHLVPDR